MLTDTDRDFFRREGFLLVPGVLTAEEVTLMRRTILDYFSSGRWKQSSFNTDRVVSEVFTVFPEFIRTTLNEKVIGAVRQLLGNEPVLLPETAIHYKFYTGWHKDTTNQERAGHLFHKKPGALMIEAGFYLQDNDEYGGGLTVMPGSHLTEDPFLKPQAPGLSERIKARLFPVTEEKNKRINPHGHRIVDIPSRSGDLVIFDFRTCHRATRPRNFALNEVPKEKEKLAFFNAFSANNSVAGEYMDYIYSRPEPFYQYLRKEERPAALLEHARHLQFKVL